MKCAAHGLAIMLATIAALGVADVKAEAAAIPALAYKRFCRDLSRGQPVMAANCEAQEVLAYRQLHSIWQSPPSDRIQDKCATAGIVSRTTGTGSYVKYLNCIITYTGN